MDSYTVAKEMVSMSTDADEVEYWRSIVRNFAKEITARSLQSVTSIVSHRSMPSSAKPVLSTASSMKSTSRVVSQSQSLSHSQSYRSNNLFKAQHLNDDESTSDSGSDTSTERNKIPMRKVIPKKIEGNESGIKRKKSSDSSNEGLSKRVDDFFSKLNVKSPIIKEVESSGASSSSSSSSSACLKTSIPPFHNRPVPVATRNTSKK